MRRWKLQGELFLGGGGLASRAQARKVASSIGHTPTVLPLSCSHQHLKTIRGALNWDMLRNLIPSLWTLFLLAAVAQAQFQFFEHMFGGNQQQQAQHQGSQNVPSDSGRYQKMWAQGEFPSPKS